MAHTYDTSDTGNPTQAKSTGTAYDKLYQLVSNHPDVKAAVATGDRSALETAVKRVLNAAMNNPDIRAAIGVDIVWKVVGQQDRAKFLTKSADAIDPTLRAGYRALAHRSA